jgi:hypothetical protein
MLPLISPREQDRYKMIDRLIDELDEDELAYLQQRLEARQAEQNAKRPADVIDFINLRDLDRRAGKH